MRTKIKIVINWKTRENKCYFDVYQSMQMDWKGKCQNWTVGMNVHSWIFEWRSISSLFNPIVSFCIKNENLCDFSLKFHINSYYLNNFSNKYEFFHSDKNGGKYTKYSIWWCKISSVFEPSFEFDKPSPSAIIPIIPMVLILIASSQQWIFSLMFFLEIFKYSLIQ